MKIRSKQLACSICETRKEKRFCPAVHGRICPQCCGEQREVSLDCPSDCVYLQQARTHEKPRRIEDLDRAALFPEIEFPEQFIYEHEHLLGGLTYSLAKSVGSNRSLADVDLISALHSIASSLETLVRSGLHYDTATPNPVQQAITAELQKAIDKYR